MTGADWLGGQQAGEVRARLLPVARRYCSDPGDAEDIVQDALVRAWRYSSRLRRSDRLWPWLRAIVRNEALRAKVRPTPEPLADFGETSQAGVEDRELLDVPVRVDVRAAFKRLGAQERLLLSLRYERDLTQHAIARALGVPEGTVKVRLHRARLNLRDELATNGIRDGHYG